MALFFKLFYMQVLKAPAYPIGIDTGLWEALVDLLVIDTEPLPFRGSPTALLTFCFNCRCTERWGKLFNSAVWPQTPAGKVYTRFKESQGRAAARRACQGQGPAAGAAV